MVAKNSDLVGFVLGNAEPFLEGEWFYLREMCVSQDYQRQGVGTSLLNNLSATLDSCSVKNIYLATDRNIPAAKFYENNGFSQEVKMGFFYKSV